MIKKGKKSEPVFYSSQHCKTSLPQRCMMSFYKLVDPVAFKLPKIQQNKTGDIIFHLCLETVALPPKDIRELGSALILKNT